MKNVTNLTPLANIQDIPIPSPKPKERNLRILFLLILLILIGTILFFSYQYWQQRKKLSLMEENYQPSPTPLVIDYASSIKDWMFYYSPSYGVLNRYIYSTKTDEKVIDAETYEISEDGQWLAYITDYGVGQSVIVHVKNLVNGETSLFDSKKQFIRRLIWSPSSRYLLCNSGTGSGGVMNIFNRSGKKITSYDTFGSQMDPVWNSDDSMLFYKFNQKVNPDRPYDNEYGVGVGSIDLPSGKKITILQPDGVTDYVPVNYEDNILTVLRRQVSIPSDWSDEEMVGETYFTIDLTDPSLELKDSSIPQSISKNLEIEKNILATGVLNLDTIPKYDWDFSVNPQDPNWILINIKKDNHGSKIYSDEIYLFNIKKPKESLQLVVKGERPQWRQLN